MAKMDQQGQLVLKEQREQPDHKEPQEPQDQRVIKEQQEPPDLKEQQEPKEQLELLVLLVSLEPQEQLVP